MSARRAAGRSPAAPPWGVARGRIPARSGRVATVPDETRRSSAVVGDALVPARPAASAGARWRRAPGGGSCATPGRTPARSRCSWSLVVVDACWSSADAAAAGADRRRRSCPRDALGRRRAGPARGRGSRCVDALLGLVQRYYSARIGEGLIYDLRTAGLRPRAAAAGRVLHPHPDRRAGLPAQQRRHRRPAGVHLDAVRRRLERRLARAGRRRDALPVLADHARRAGAACRCSCCRRGASAPGCRR